MCNAAELGEIDGNFYVYQRDKHEKLERREYTHLLGQTGVKVGKDLIQKASIKKTLICTL